MWMFLHFTNCLFALGKATLLILPGGEITTTMHINYCVSVLSNTPGQLCLPEETGVPRETHKVWQIFGDQLNLSPPPPPTTLNVWYFAAMVWFFERGFGGVVVRLLAFHL